MQGLISYEDFKRVFQSADDEQESRTAGTVGESNFEEVHPKMIPELVELNKPTGPEETIVITEDILMNFKVKVRSMSNPNALLISTNTLYSHRTAVS